MPGDVQLFERDEIDRLVWRHSQKCSHLNIGKWALHGRECAQLAPWDMELASLGEGQLTRLFLAGLDRAVWSIQVVGLRGWSA